MSFLLFLYALCIELYIQLCFIDTVFLLDIKSRTVEYVLVLYLFLHSFICINLIERSSIT